MQKHHRVFAWYVPIAMWVVRLLQNRLFSAFAVETMPYSQFLELLGQGKITDVAITSNQIHGHFQDREVVDFLKEPEKFTRLGGKARGESPA